MNMQQVKEIAKQRGIKAGSMKKAELVRAIQSDEGNDACYGTGRADSCGQDACLWRDDCN